MYRAREFARLAGVTVRALHHYDRLGLLKPARTGSGYRVYRDTDLERLEQIVALKFIGVPLRRIGKLLDPPGMALGEALFSQRRALEEKRRLLDTAIGAISEAEAALASGERAGSSALTKIIEVIEMQNDEKWPLKYFEGEAKEKVEARRSAWSPELQAQAEQQWADLYRDVRLALDEDPGSPRAQALVERRNELLRALTGGDPQLAGGVKRLYADRANWPAEFAARIEPFTDQRVWDFFQRALAARTPDQRTS